MKVGYSLYVETDDLIGKQIVDTLNAPGTDRQPLMRELIAIGFLARRMGVMIVAGQLYVSGQPAFEKGDNLSRTSSNNALQDLKENAATATTEPSKLLLQNLRGLSS